MPIYGRSRPHTGADLIRALPASRNAEALGQWSTALATVTTAPVRWMAIGDGVTEGQGATTRANRWIEQALATIRTSKSVTGGQGFVSAAYQVTAPGSTWSASQVAYAGSVSTATTTGVGYRVAVLSTFAGGGGAEFGAAPFGAASFGKVSGSGFGTSAFGRSPFGRGTASASTPGSVTFTVTGDLVDLWYVGEPTSGSLTYRVDAGSDVSVTTTGAHDLRRISGIPLGATGSHTVTVTVSTGTVYVSGLTVYSGDAGSGIQLYDAARVGATSATYAGGLVDLTDTALTVAPDLVSIELGYNDAAAGITPGQTVSNIQQVISMLRALPKPPSIVLVIGYYPDGSVLPNWSSYVPGLRRMAVTDPNLGLVDLSLSLPLADASGTGLYQTDGRYPNNTGHAQIAARFSDFTNVTIAAPPPPVPTGAGRALLLAGIA